MLIFISEDVRAFLAVAIDSNPAAIWAGLMHFCFPFVLRSLPGWCFVPFWGVISYSSYSPEKIFPSTDHLASFFIAHSLDFAVPRWQRLEVWGAWIQIDLRVKQSLYICRFHHLCHLYFHSWLLLSVTYCPGQDFQMWAWVFASYNSRCSEKF